MLSEQDHDVPLLSTWRWPPRFTISGHLHVALRGLPSAELSTWPWCCAACRSPLRGAQVDQQDDQDRVRWFAEIALATFCTSTVLPVRGGATIRTALAEADRREDVHHAHRDLVGREVSRRDAAVLGRAREVLEVHDATRLGGGLAVHDIDAAEREEVPLLPGSRTGPSTRSPVRSAKRRTCDGEA